MWIELEIKHKFYPVEVEVNFFSKDSEEFDVTANTGDDLLNAVLNENYEDEMGEAAYKELKEQKNANY